MALFNNGFPATYQQYYNPGQYQMPYQAQQNQAQGMTPPIVHADIYQVAGEQEAASFPVAAGASQMMLAKDDSAIYIKTAYANGQTKLDVYVRRAPAQPEKAFDPSEYVTRDELEKKLAELTGKAGDKE